MSKYFNDLKNYVSVRLSSCPNDQKIKKFDWLGDCACPTYPNKKMTNEELVRLKFANREYEIDLICNPGQPPIIVIDAPAGYGKTVLLEEVKFRYNKKRWNYALISLAKIQGKFSIRNEISKQVGGKIIDCENEKEADSILRSEMAKAKKVILLFDDVERANKEDLDWLNELVLECKEWLRALNFRTIFAGRYVNTGENSFRWLNYKKIRLTPFIQDIVKNVIEDTIKKYPPSTDQKLQEKDINSWAYYITSLSGGHPKAIQRLITALKDSYYSLVFSRDEQQRLFNLYVEEDLNNITKTLDDFTKEALNIFSIFRQLTFNTIQALQEKNEFPKTANIQSIFTELINLGFITKSEPNPFFSDNIVRQLIITKMKIFNPDRYKELNNIAQSVYEAWIESLLRSKISFGLSPKDLIPIYVQEYMYHFFQQLSSTPSVFEITSFLWHQSNLFLKVLGENSADPNYRKKIENILLNDNEIRASLIERDLSIKQLLNITFEENLKTNERTENLGEKKMIPQIFLSYDREDKEKVERLYKKLSDVGFKPWMDIKDILPGEQWEYSINKAVKNSHFFIVCLSTHSVSKRGFLQIEIKDALKKWKEKLEEDIYLIPVRFEKCEVSESLKPFQWVDLFEQDGFSKLVKAIEVGLKRLSN